MPLTTSDVQFTFDTIRDPRTHGVEHLRPLLADVAAIELITAREVRLRLNRPSPWALRALAEIPILPMHVYDGSLLAGGALIGTGPWKLASNKGGVIHLTRNEDDKICNLSRISPYRRTPSNTIVRRASTVGPVDAEP